MSTHTLYILLLLGMIGEIFLYQNVDCRLLVFGSGGGGGSYPFNDQIVLKWIGVFGEIAQIYPYMWHQPWQTPIRIIWIIHLDQI